MSNGGSKQVAVSVFRSMNNALVICFPVGRSPGHPQETHGNPGGMVQFGYFPAPQGHTHGICSNFAQRYISLDQSFFGPFYFISVPKFDTVSHVSLLPRRQGLFVINFMPFTQRLLMVFVCHKKTIPQGYPMVDPRGSK